MIANCFDGASNISGKNKGLSTRLKECAPLSFYIHCYGHLLNLVLYKKMSEVMILSNALEVIQELHNFIEGSTKRHVMLQELIHLTDDKSAKH